MVSRLESDSSRPRELVLPDSFGELYHMFSTRRVRGKFKSPIKGLKQASQTGMQIQHLLADFRNEHTENVSTMNRKGPWTFLQTGPFYFQYRGHRHSARASQVMTGYGGVVSMEHHEGIVIFQNENNPVPLTCYHGMNTGLMGIITRDIGTLHQLNEEGIGIFDEMVTQMYETKAGVEPSNPVYGNELGAILNGYPVKDPIFDMPPVDARTGESVKTFKLNEDNPFL